MNNRTNLISIVQGSRGSYWYEVVTTTDGTAYQLHTPNDGGDNILLLPCTWAAALLNASRFLNRTEAEQLPKHNDGRKYNGSAISAAEAQALLKWAL